MNEETDVGFVMVGAGDGEPITLTSFSPCQATYKIQIGISESGNSQAPNKDIQHLKAPHMGMLFGTIEEAKNYYENYGRQEGFWIRTQSSCKTRSRSNEMTSIIYVCAHQSKIVSKTDRENVREENEERQTSEKENQKRRSRNCSTVKGGCMASMWIIHDKWSNKWKVSVYNGDHNHKSVTPVRRMKMKSNRHMPKAVKDLTEAFQRENLQIGKVPSILGGEHIGFDNRDCYNHLMNVRHIDLEGGDAQSVLTYFRKKTS